MLSPSEAEEIASEAFEERNRDRNRLKKIDLYYKGEPHLMWLPIGAPRELQALAQMSRIRIMELVVKATTQQMFLDGYASQDEIGAQIAWSTWQRNKWDRKQIGVHKAAGKYGVAYATVMPSDSLVPALRPVSPMKMTALYGDDPDWARFALEERDGGVWRLYDDTHTYDLRRGKRQTRSVRGSGARAITFEMIPGTAAPHEQQVTPVVRYVADEDLDDPVRGDVEPLFTLNDQINLVTFHLLVAEHYGAHGRKIIIGRMIAEIEAKLVKSSANTMMTVNANPEDVKFEELSQTSLDGFLESRQAALRMMSALSQTPAHELLGTLANLSAAALVESRESAARKLSERQTVIGESHEQLLGQAGQLMGVALDPMARVRWKPTLDQRSIKLVELLALMAEKLGVPAAALWEHLPFAAADISEFRKAAQEQRAEQTQQMGDAEPEPESVDEERELDDIGQAA